MKKILGFILAVIGAAITVFGILLTVNKNKSISVVGGADGPTSVFLAGKLGGGSTIIEIFAGIVLLATGIFLTVKKK